MPALLVSAKTCLGCRLCEQWCAWAHIGQANPARARLSVQRLHEHYINQVLACRQCDDPACVAACPSSALTRNPITGGLALNSDDCLLCEACVLACTTGVLRLDPLTALPLACDLCDGDPQCVRHCPEGVLVYSEAPEMMLPEAERHAAPILHAYTWPAGGAQ